MRRLTQLLPVILVSLWIAAASGQDLALPLKENSVRFLIIADSGTGDSVQRELAARMNAFLAKFPFTFAIMLRDNMYGSERPQDYAKKFEAPYKAMLDAKVEFNAALGNHDDPNKRFSKPLNLNGVRYRTFG